MKSLLRRLQSNEESSSSEVGKGSQLRDSWVHNARGRLSFPGRRGDAKCATGLSGWLNTVARHTLPLQPPSSSSCPSHNANEGSPMVAETLSSVVTKPNMQADSNTGVGLVDTDKDEGPFSTLSLEKECQLQLARASSVQDKPNVVHIEVVSKQISLGNLSSPAHTPAEALAVRYWHHNVLDYDDNIVDGFYDVYGDVFGSNKETMTSLVDLQRRSSSKNISQEVVLVDRVADPDLKELVKNVATLAVDSKAVSLGPLKSGLVEKIAGLVAKQMGGPVIDLDEILKRWKICREEFRFSHQSIVLPLGCLQVGLVRHRALLFKVLADTVGIPCKLLKGRQFTGSDEGAINVIRLADAREFIVDLMGVPGTLIPSNRFSVGVVTAVELHPVFLSMGDMKTELIHSLVPSEFGMSKGCMDNDEGVEMYAAEHPGNDVEKQANETQEHQMMGLPPPRPSHSRSMKSYAHDRSPSWTEGIGSLFLQDMKVMDVSQYMMNAAKENPQLAQKLHDVLLESGVVAPCSFFTDISPRELKLQASEEKKPSVVDGKKDLEGSVMEIQDSSAESEYSHAPMHKEFQVVEERLNESPPKICSVEGLADTRKDNTQSSDGILEMVSNGGDGLRDFQDRDMYSCGFPAEEEFLSDKSNKSISVKSDSVMDDVSEWEIPWEEIAIGERIGIGSYGEVYRGDWHGTVSASDQEVAVKKFLDQDISGDALEEFRSEVRIMTRLRHPNVVLFMGAITRVPNLSIVTEFLPRGSLYRLIHRTNNQLDERRRLCMALDVARGMNYLHRSTPVIVHRDLKSPNLLVDKNWVVKVCDFGLSRMKSNTFLSSKSSSGTPEWMAPEHLRNEPSNEKCDVYSFGVILWELSTLKKPWGSLSPMQVVGAVGFQHRRLDIPDYVDPIIAKLVLQCWQSDPKLRPSFAEILAALKPLQKLFLPHYLSDAKKPGILVDCPQCKILQFPDENKVKRADP